jgi:alpha-glucosidase
VTARQHGANWYVGAMTNRDAPDFEIPVGFLGAGGYEAQLFADGKDADKVAASLTSSQF